MEAEAVERRAVPLRPQPSARPAKRADPTAVGAGEIHVGLGLLATNGRFPALSCAYEHFGSFQSYARAMTALTLEMRGLS